MEVREYRKQRYTWLDSQNGTSTDGGSYGRTCFQRPMVVCERMSEYLLHIVEFVLLYELTKLVSVLTRHEHNTRTDNFSNPHIYQLYFFDFFFGICNARRTWLCDHVLKAIFLVNMMYDATPSYCWIATVLHISFPSFHFKYKWPYWPDWIKEVKISIKSMYKEHLDDEVEPEELAAQYSYKIPKIATLEWRRVRERHS